MGIENRNGILSGIDQAKANEIREALKDGKISDSDAKNLGLTKEEQEYLNNAFSFGEVQIGDKVIYNKGEEKDARGDWQLTQLAQRQTLKLKGSTTGNYGIYEYNENTKQSSVNYYTAADEPISQEQFYKLEGMKPDGDYRVDKDGNIQEHTLVGGLMAFLKGAGEGALFTGAVALAPLGALASCEPAIQQNVELDITLKANSSLSDVKAQLQKLTELTESMLDTLKQNLMWQIKNGASLEAILDAFGANNQLLDAILNELMKGNQLLQDIRAGMETNNKQNAEILKVTVQILQKLTNIENSVNSIKAKFPDLSAQLTAILNAIKNNQGGQTDPTEILAKLDKIVALLEAIANSSKVTEATTKAILDAINKLSADQAANFVKVINAINNLGNKLTNLQPLLDEILEAINNNTKNDDKNAQLILDAIANLKLSGGNVDLSTVTQLLKDIKDMFSNCLGKFNTLLAKLENYHGDIVDLLNKILDAIKNHTCNCNCGNGSHEGILDDIGGLIS